MNIKSHRSSFSPNASEIVFIYQLSKHNYLERKAPHQSSTNNRNESWPSLHSTIKPHTETEHVSVNWNFCQEIVIMCVNFKTAIAARYHIKSLTQLYTPVPFAMKEKRLIKHRLIIYRLCMGSPPYGTTDVSLSRTYTFQQIVINRGKPNPPRSRINCHRVMLSQFLQCNLSH